MTKPALANATINPVVEYRMNHPSKDWLNPKTGDLFDNKKDRATLNHNFRFHFCRDPKDAEDCFIWEFNRTREFIGWKYPKKDRKNIISAFPFSVNNNNHWKGVFPAKPYLSFDKKVRTRFSSLSGENYSERNFEKLLLPFHQPYGESRDVSFKLPVELFINPKWGKTKTSRLFREQWDEIEQKLLKISQVASNICGDGNRSKTLRSQEHPHRFTLYDRFK